MQGRSQQVEQNQSVAHQAIEPAEGAIRSSDWLCLIDGAVEIEARANARFRSEKPLLSSLCRLFGKKSRKRVHALARIVTAYDNTKDFHAVIMEIGFLSKERQQDFTNLKTKLIAREVMLIDSVTDIRNLIENTSFDYDSSIAALSYWLRRLDASVRWIEKQITALAAVDNAERRAVAGCFAKLRDRDSERRRAGRLARRTGVRPISDVLHRPQIAAEAEAQRRARKAAAKAELARLAAARSRDRAQKAEVERQRYRPTPRPSYSTKAEQRVARQRERAERARNRVEART